MFAPPTNARMQAFPKNFREALMVPGIDPKVDIVFKRLFGTEANADLLIDLLNAVLAFPPAGVVTAVEILNPFHDKEALDDKLSILDIKARDAAGRQFNVEMQVLPYAAEDVARGLLRFLELQAPGAMDKACVTDPPVPDPDPVPDLSPQHE